MNLSQLRKPELAAAAQPMLQKMSKAALLELLAHHQIETPHTTKANLVQTVLDRFTKRDLIQVCRPHTGGSPHVHIHQMPEDLQRKIAGLLDTQTRASLLSTSKTLHRGTLGKEFKHHVETVGKQNIITNIMRLFKTKLFNEADNVILKSLMKNKLKNPSMDQAYYNLIIDELLSYNRFSISAILNKLKAISDTDYSSANFYIASKVRGSAIDPQHIKEHMMKFYGFYTYLLLNNLILEMNTRVDDAFNYDAEDAGHNDPDQYKPESLRLLKLLNSNPNVKSTWLLKKFNVFKYRMTHKYMMLYSQMIEDGGALPEAMHKRITRTALFKKYADSLNDVVAPV